MRHSAAPDHDAGQRADRRALAEVVDLIDDGVYDAASVLAWEIQRTSPGDPNVWLLLARIDLLRERHAAAIYASRMATRLDPSSADAWVVLAQTAVRRERWWTEGLDAALQATALTPGDAEPWTALARLQLATGEPYDAAVSAERAVRIDDDHRGAHIVLGQIALEAQEWQHAEAAFRRALELDGDDHDARVGLATALEAQDIDPSAELARYGSPVVLRGRGTGLLARVPGRSGLRTSPLLADSRRLLLGVGACLVVGLVIGAFVPEIGVGRGLVAAIAVLLMWFAVRPVRGRRRDDANVMAQEATRDEVVEAAVEQSDGDEAPTMDEAGDALPVDRVDPSRRDVPAPAAELSEGEWGPAELSSGAEVGDAASSAGADEGVPDGATLPAHGAAEDDRAALPVEEDAAAHGDGPDEPAVAAMPAVDATGVVAPMDDTNSEVGTAPADAVPMVRDQDNVDDAADAVVETDAETAAVELPHDPDALIELSRERLAASDLEVAHAAASRLEAVAPGTVEAHRALGAVALAEHDYDQAREHYSKILELEPLDQEAHERLAMIGEQRPRGRMRRLMGWR